MKKILLTLAFMVSPFHFAVAADTYKLDTNHTNVFWHANHFGFSSPSGKFSDVEGTLLLDEAKPENSSVKVTIKTNSLVTGISKFDEHLKSKDFFDVKTYPIIQFTSTKVELTGKDTAKVRGTLTMHGATRDAVLEVHLNKIGEHPMSKEKAAGFSAKTTIKRSDFGINYALAAADKPGVADEVEVTIESEANIVMAK